RNQPGNAAAIGVEAGECSAQKAFLRRDDRNVNDAETNSQHKRYSPTKQGQRKTSSDQHRPKIKRVAGVRIWAVNRQFAILLHIAGSTSTQPHARKHQRKAPDYSGRTGCVPPKVEYIENRCQEAQRYADPAGHSLPAGNPIQLRRARVLISAVVGHQAFSCVSSSLAARNTSSGSMVSNPTSGSGRRV